MKPEQKYKTWAGNQSRRTNKETTGISKIQKKETFCRIKWNAKTKKKNKKKKTAIDKSDNKTGRNK